MTNKDQSKFPYDRSEDGTLTTEPRNVRPKSREECKRIAEISIRLNEDGSYGYTHSGMLSYEHIMACINIHSGLPRPKQEPQKVDWEFFTDGAYWDMCAVRPIGDKSFNSPNLFHVSNLKEGERLASLLNSHCAYSAQPTQPPIDLEELKWELDESGYYTPDGFGLLNHLASKFYFMPKKSSE